jgi:hypothetical protein
VTAPYKESPLNGDSFDVSDPSFQESSGSSAISRWVARYYAPLFESNIFKVSVVRLKLTNSMIFLLVDCNVSYNLIDYKA